MINYNLDRSGRIPLHHQLHDILLAQIESGQLSPGDRIATEHELSAIYGISRTTVKQAIHRLVQSGHLYRLQGKGTFVKSPPVSRHLASIISFSEEIRQRGRLPITRVIDLTLTEAGDSLSKAMNCEQGAKVIRYSRLRLADEEIMGIQTSYLPYLRYPALVDPNILDGPSLYQTMEELYNVKPFRACEEYRIRWPKVEEAKLIGLEKPQAVFGVKRWTYLSNGELMEYAESLLRGDKYTLQIELTSNQRLESRVGG